MKAVMLEVPESLPAERRSIGLDKRDEMWAGVLHIVLMQNGNHQRLLAWLLIHLHDAAKALGLTITPETGLFAADDDYRVPDVIAASEQHWSERGVEVPAEQVIEIRAPGEDTMEKVDWYEAIGVGEVLVIDRDSWLVRQWARDVPTDPLSERFAVRGLARLGLRHRGLRTSRDVLPVPR